MAEKDQALVRRTLEGESHVFGVLVERYAALVHGVVLEVVRRQGEVEDLSQEVFSTAFEELSDLRNPSKFGQWLAQIADQGVVWGVVSYLTFPLRTVIEDVAFSRLGFRSQTLCTFG